MESLLPYSVDSPWASAFGAASGFLEGQNTAKRQKRADAAEDDRLKQEASRFAAQQAYQTQELDYSKKRLEYEGNADKRAQNADALKSRLDGIGLPPPPKPKKPYANTPEGRAQEYRDKASYYDANGAYNLAKEYRADGLAEVNSYYTTAKTAETGARTKLLGSQDWRLRTENPREFYAKLQFTENENKRRDGAKYTQHLQDMQQRLTIAGMRRDHAGAGSQVALSKWLAGMEYNTAVRTTVDEFNRSTSEYQQVERENHQSDLYNKANPTGTQMIIVPQGPAPQMAPMPQIVIQNGQPTVVQPRPQPAKPSAPKPREQAPAPTPAPQQGGNPLQVVQDFFGHFFHGGDKKPAGAPVQRNGKTYYPHADGNYYLTP